MPVLAATIISALGKLGITLIMSIISETIAKRWIVHSLQRLAKMTGSSYDDQLVEDLRKGWNVED